MEERTYQGISLQVIEEHYVDKEVQTDNVFPNRRLSLSSTDSMSTPPSQLRKEISCLREELMEAYEFHDLEFQVLKEEGIFFNGEGKMDGKILQLEKLLDDAKKETVNANREIMNLKIIIQNLNKKLKDESNQNLILKEQLEEQNSTFQLNLNSREHEIQVLQRDKNDYEFKLEKLHENYNRKITELQTALDYVNEKESGASKFISYNELELKLTKEIEKTSELSKKVDELNIELLQNKEKIKLLEKRHEAVVEGNQYMDIGSTFCETLEWEKRLNNGEEVEKQGTEISPCLEIYMQILTEQYEKLIKELQLKYHNLVCKNKPTSEELKLAFIILKEQRIKLSKFSEGSHYVYESMSSNSPSTTDVTIKAEECWIVDSNFEKKLLEACTSFENQIKMLKDEYNNKIRELEVINDHLRQRNLELEDNLLITNKSLFTLKQKLEKHSYQEKNVEIDSAHEEALEDYKESYSLNDSRKLLKVCSSLITVENETRGDESLFNFTIHTFDHENKQLVVHSEFQIMEFVNEFRNILLKKKIISPEELNGCSNIFYLLLNKYLILKELCSRLNTDFYEYCLSEEKKYCEMLSFTVNYLDKLCIELQESDSTLNFSSSILSFKDSLPSSTILYDESEIEILAVDNDATFATSDPLALTQDLELQISLNSPLKNGEKIQQTSSENPLKLYLKSHRTPKKSFLDSSEKKNCNDLSLVSERSLAGDKTCLNNNKHRSLCSSKEFDENIFDSKEMINSNLNSLGLLEERISRLELISLKFKTPREQLLNEIISLQKNLSEKMEEIASLKEKLIVEVIGLDPELKGSLDDDSLQKVLSVFINTIMDSCNKISERLSEKFLVENRALKSQIESYENRVYDLTIQLEIMKEKCTALQNEKFAMENVISKSKEEINRLQSETQEVESLKMKIQDLTERIRESDDLLKNETYLRTNILRDIEMVKVICAKDEHFKSQYDALKLNSSQMLATHSLSIEKHENGTGFQNTFIEHSPLIPQNEETVLSQHGCNMEIGKLKTLGSCVEQYLDVNLEIISDGNVLNSEPIEGYLHEMKNVTCPILENVSCSRGGDGNLLIEGCAHNYGSKCCEFVEDLESKLLSYLGLTNSKVSIQDIIDKIENKIDNVRKDFLARIDVLRQDNQHLDDNNSVLQEEMKKLIEENNLNRIKLSDYVKSEEMLKKEISALRDKFGRKSDFCNRRLDKLEELNNALVELLSKIMALTGMEDLQNHNLFSVRYFENSSKEILDRFVLWINSKFSEIASLSRKVEELDEECESYSDVIKQAKKETVKLWEEGQCEINSLKAQIDELVSENTHIKLENEKLLLKIRDTHNDLNVYNDANADRDIKEICRCARYSEEINALNNEVKSKISQLELLNEKNSALQEETKTMQGVIAELQNKNSELDEECESYAKVIKEANQEAVKVWVEGRNEIEKLKSKIDELEQYKIDLESENTNLLREINTLRNIEQSKSYRNIMINNETPDNSFMKEGDLIKALQNKVYVREMKILELEQLNEKHISHKSQLEYLENSLALCKQQLTEEKEKNSVLRMQMEKSTTNVINKSEEEIAKDLNKLRINDTLGADASQKIGYPEKLHKLERDNKILRELCRSRYNEIQLLEKKNILLKGREKISIAGDITE